MLESNYMIKQKRLRPLSMPAKQHILPAFFCPEFFGMVYSKSNDQYWQESDSPLFEPEETKKQPF
jgi:hypothetical protein